ncbi:MAG: adenine phosphoribosyltransferase, adenine phosphoribosyltransferase [Candidatus Peregrinibacteria bacterium GW2011_GWF2_43_17]|nr:MAG: adenine phosphoribosyltransferase, adenine phosphoribosyltransferase [Candidatus Peregrinibacteria bacterium GW2011_GWF2_43_17]KKT20606.1 MAG: Adenine phosphoribosyltransferase [Candidatus Peregrinibacteria bacterium GW2011_GWA2_43_8]HAU39876.1 adenine phosphoribosyltransferase [Candidatus Peregrinibacteria bacterium]
MDLKKVIRNIPDFPKKGIIFKDITPLLADPTAFKFAVDQMTDFARAQGAKAIVGIDSRGFIFGSVIAYKLGIKFVPVRKKGKLPYKAISEKYNLEYGTAEIEIHEDALAKGEKVLIVDDLLATGGTMKATCNLVEKLGAEICGIAFVINLTFLNGMEKIKNYKTLTLIDYE